MGNGVYLLTPLAYLLGTFPSALLVARRRGVDIMHSGSGNPGASNTARTVGARWGIVVFLLDGLKGAIPAAVGLAVDGRGGAFALVGAATLGHMFPATRASGLRFKGGKGVATVSGAMFVLQPIVSLILLGVWFAVSRLTRTASLASIAIIVLLPVGVAIRGAAAWEIAAICALGALVLGKHWRNIQRLIRREELSLDKNR